MTVAAAKKAVAKKAASGKEKKDDSYRVSAPLVQVQVGEQVLQYSFGDVLPNGVNEDSLKHLLENGLIQKGEVVAQTESGDSSDVSDDE